jgi:hypothetical protein
MQGAAGASSGERPQFGGGQRTCDEHEGCPRGGIYVERVARIALTARRMRGGADLMVRISSGREDDWWLARPEVA